MQIQNSFSVPVDRVAAWRLPLGVPRMARAMAGARLTEERPDRSYRGEVAVKLGPVRLTFAGEARITELDEAAYQAKVEAKGSDTKGRGSAQAKLAFALVPEDQATRVEVTTDLQLVGAVAQYGRGAGFIKELATQLVGEFAGNLRREIAEAEPPTPALPSQAPAAVARTESAAPAPAPLSGFALIARALGALVA